ncbi:unnamed protein product [Haemonchus placei]|uniref:Phorbol-ester/DAG-type domain-containing protein n=1 Tax=Haemonchus placei TaxID=6290 RepID=A0A0N4W2J9_HAEPC|nr:unnamed protein product [Haemonchus placei]
MGLSCSLCGHVMLSYNNYSKHLCCTHGDEGAKAASELVKERRLTAKVTGQHECTLCNLRSSLKALNKALNQEKTKNSADCDKDLSAPGPGSTDTESEPQDSDSGSTEMESESLDSSGDSDSHNDSEKSDSRGSVSDAIKEGKCTKSRDRAEKMLDHIRAYINRLDRKGTDEAKLALHEVERKLWKMLNTFGEKLTEDIVLVELDSDEDDDIDSVDQGSPDEEDDNASHDLDASDEDDDDVFCRKCGDVQPPGNSDVLTDWIRCNDCDAWAHKECLDSRGCIFCGIGMCETASSTESEVSWDQAPIYYQNTLTCTYEEVIRLLQG